MPPGTISPSHEITIPLTGNSCRSCARRLEHRLHRLDSVSDARVDRVKGTVTFTLADSTAEAAAMETIRRAGFEPLIATVVLPVPALGYGPECQALEAEIQVEQGVKRALARPSDASVRVDYVVGATTIDIIRDAARRAGLDARHPETALDLAARHLARRRSAARAAAATAVAAAAATLIALPHFWTGAPLAIPEIERATAEIVLAAGAALLLAFLARAWVLASMRPWIRRVASSDGLQGLAIAAAAGLAFATAVPSIREVDPALPFTVYPSLYWVIAFVSLSRWMAARIGSSGEERPAELDAVSRRLAVLSAAAAVLAFVIWFVFGQEPRLVNAMIALSATLAASCASVAAIAATAAIDRRNRAFRAAGIGVNSAAALRALDGVDVLAFETHGTITTGEHRLSESVLLGGRTQKDLLRSAGSLAYQSRDRVLGTIEAHAPKPMPLITERSEEFRGIAAHVDGGAVLLGHPEWVKSRGIALDEIAEDVAEFTAAGRSVRVLAIDGQVAGALAFREELRPEAREELERIRSLRLPLQLLSDADDAALSALADAVGVKRRFAGSPEAQRSEITRLRRQGRGVALLTTEPAGSVASAADVAIVLGETPYADLAVRDLGAAATASEISHGTSRGIRSITRVAVIWHLVALPVAAFPAVGAWPAIAAAGACALTALSLWSACRRRLPEGGGEQ